MFSNFAAAPASAADPRGPWNLMLRSSIAGTRSISYQNWTLGTRPLCWQADTGQWRNTGQQVRAWQQITVIAYANRGCPATGVLRGGQLGMLVPEQTSGLTNYWLSIDY
ncbi:hypothetical protein [Micromonospora sp. KC721]|uniref:hypothetical protein n=1 Tax=Micromonospora sp. KC721 TaxID=2530380 RepID=UPI0010481783|nr:hypothetical protein [Micromonospora sp. KC721]TDB71317.1 hypothetical protein E1182_25400 [Micromonospora sp. KC721]